MKTSKELFEKLSNDEEFAKEYNAAVVAKREAGASNYYETFIPAANDLGYELSKEEVDAIIDSQSEMLSEEELGKVAGGTSCWTASIIFTVVDSLFSVAFTVDEFRKK